MEFGGSGEDSFVAVVVTKLTGALLFILLLTMVIMALIPKAVDLPAGGDRGRSRMRAAGDRHAGDAPRGDRGPSLCGGAGRDRREGASPLVRGRPAARRPELRPLLRPDPRHASRRHGQPAALVLRVGDGDER
jgi:hypothetical protein